MHLLNLCSVYLLIGVVVGMFNYVATWRAYRRAGRANELPVHFLERSVCHHALTWPETAFWCVLCLVVMVLVPRKQR